MTDDLTKMIKKILSATEGQRLEACEKVYISNSLDYGKWNNRLRWESNGPVFRVMGQFISLPRIIEMTHEIFENCLIYFNDRPDLMFVRNDGTVGNIDPDTLVVWEGQLGGFEGLRQKGWSIITLFYAEKHELKTLL